MPACTFFGHRDCPETIKPKLREVLIDLIINRGVDMFFVGHQGQFDAYVHKYEKEVVSHFLFTIFISTMRVPITR